MSGSPHGVLEGVQFFAVRPAMNAFTTSAFGKSFDAPDSRAESAGSSMFLCALVANETARTPPHTTSTPASQSNKLRGMAFLSLLLSGRLRHRPFGRRHLRRNRRFRRLGEAAVQRLLRQLNASVLDHLSFGIDKLVQRHADLPGTRVHRRILERRLVLQLRGTGSRETLSDLQSAACEVASPVEPHRIV